MQIAARNAFWSLAVQPTLAQLAAHAECNLQECTSDLERVFTLLMSVLKCKEEEALATCRLRTYFPQRERHEDELMSADAALEMRTKDNQQAVLKQKKQTTAWKLVVKGFARDRQAKSLLVHAGSAEKRAARKDLLKSVSKGKYPKSIPEGPLTQPEAKRLLPPDCFIWRATRQHAWRGHFPLERLHLSKSWSYGHRDALFSWQPASGDPGSRGATSTRRSARCPGSWSRDAAR